MYVPLFIFIYSLTGIFGVRIMEIKVPPRVKTGDSAILDCLFDLEGQTLYSLNWWLNNVQFYQFDPSERKQQIVYETPGVDVDRAESNLRIVTLRNVTKVTSGEFKCEIVADFPSYERDSLTAPMEVTDVPSNPPVISLEHSQYNIGDHLRANCTAQGSNNHPVILWYINGKKINSKHVKHINASSLRKANDRSDRYSRDGKRHRRRRRLKRNHAFSPVVSHVTMELKRSHFTKDGRSILTCTAIYAGIFHKASKLDLTRPGAHSVKPSLRVSPEISASRQELQSSLSLVFPLLSLFSSFFFLSSSSSLSSLLPFANLN